MMTGMVLHQTSVVPTGSTSCLIITISGADKLSIFLEVEAFWCGVDVVAGYPAGGSIVHKRRVGSSQLVYGTERIGITTCASKLGIERKYLFNVVGVLVAWIAIIRRCFSLPFGSLVFLLTASVYFPSLSAVFYVRLARLVETGLGVQGLQGLRLGY